METFKLCGGSIELLSRALDVRSSNHNVIVSNIANADTPGYVREKAIFVPAPVQQVGDLTFGLGVEIVVGGRGVVGRHGGERAVHVPGASLWPRSRSGCGHLLARHHILRTPHGSTTVSRRLRC